jgi:hypothetical protein
MAVRKIGSTRRKRKSKVVTHRRRRRISGIGSKKGGIMDLVAVVGGAVAARELSNVVTKQFPGTSLAMVAGGQVALGYFLPHFVKQPWAKNVGLGMMAIGGTQLAVSAGLISGTGNRMQYTLSNARKINGGTTGLSTISGGTSALSTISGHRMISGVPQSAGGLVSQMVQKKFAGY